MISRRYLFALLGILALAPATAEASGSARHEHRRIDSVTLRADGRGSLIAVTFAGRPHAHLLRSTDPIASYAVADVDNDGDLDILAASDRSGLILWRNAGRGRFVVASLSASRAVTHRSLGVRAFTTVDEGLVASDDRYDAAMPRAPSSDRSDPTASVLASDTPFVPRTPTVRRSGRAPPQPSL